MRQTVICEYGLYKYNLIDWLIDGEQLDRDWTGDRASCLIFLKPGLYVKVKQKLPTWLDKHCDVFWTQYTADFVSRTTRFAQPCIHCLFPHQERTTAHIIVFFLFSNWCCQVLFFFIYRSCSEVSVKCKDIIWVNKHQTTSCARFWIASLNIWKAFFLQQWFWVLWNQCMSMGVLPIF